MPGRNFAANAPSVTAPSRSVHMREDHVLKALSASRAIIPIELAPHVDFIDGFGGLASRFARSRVE